MYRLTTAGKQHFSATLTFRHLFVRTFWIAQLARGKPFDIRCRISVPTINKIVTYSVESQLHIGVRGSHSCGRVASTQIRGIYIERAK